MYKISSKQLGSAFIVVSALAGFMIGVTLVPKVYPLILSSSPDGADSTPQKYQLLTINKNDGYHVSVPEENREYLWYQLQYPSSYHVFTPDMFDSYHATGGDGFPRPLFFTKDPTLFTDPAAGRPDWLTNRGECIAVLHQDIQTADDVHWWRNQTLGSKTYRVVREQNTHLGYFDYNIGHLELDKQRGEIFDAFLAIPQRVSYYFRTCGTTNESDFLKVLETFDIRAYRVRGG